MSTGPNVEAVRKDGSTVPVEINLSAITLSSGRAVLASIRDVSDRKMSEAELRISDERFRVAFDRAPIGMALLDLASTDGGRFLRVNRALLHVDRILRDCTAGNELRRPSPTRATRRGRRRTSDRLANGAAARWDTDKRYRTRRGRRLGALRDLRRPRRKRHPVVRGVAGGGHHRPQTGGGAAAGTFPRADHERRGRLPGPGATDRRRLLQSRIPEGLRVRPRRSSANSDAGNGRGESRTPSGSARSWRPPRLGTAPMQSGNSPGRTENRGGCRACIADHRRGRADPAGGRLFEDITERKADEAGLLAARAEAERANAAKTEFLSRMSHELRSPAERDPRVRAADRDGRGVRRPSSVGAAHPQGRRYFLGLIDEVLGHHAIGGRGDSDVDGTGQRRGCDCRVSRHAARSPTNARSA